MAVLSACSTSMGASSGVADSDRYTDTGSKPESQRAASPAPATELPVVLSPAAHLDTALSYPPPGAALQFRLSSASFPSPTPRPPAVSPSRPAALQGAAPTVPPALRARNKPAHLPPGSARAPGRDTPARPRPGQAPDLQILKHWPRPPWLRAHPRPGAPACRRHEQRSHRLGQAQRGGQQLRGVLAAVRLMPRSRSLTDRGLRPAASASSSLSARPLPATAAATQQTLAQAALPSPASLRRPSSRRPAILHSAEGTTQP